MSTVIYLANQQIQVITVLPEIERFLSRIVIRKMRRMAASSMV